MRARRSLLMCALASSALLLCPGWGPERTAGWVVGGVAKWVPVGVAERSAERGLAHAAGSGLGPTDFAWGMQLRASPGQALQTFVLPSDVLERCDPSREQLSVFNAAGESVPHAVRELSGASEAPQSAPIAAFPILGSSGGNTAARAEMRVQVERDATGRLTKVALETSDSSATESTKPTPPVVSYILDTSQVPREIESLRFELTGHEPTFIWPLKVSTSSDLALFSRETQRGSLATLNHAGQRVDQRELQLGGIRAPYLRLTWDAESPPATITGVTAVLARSTQPAPLQTREFQASPSTDPALRDFDLGAALPLRELDLVLDTNTLIDAEILGANAPSGPFTELHRGVFYELEHNGSIAQNERVRLPWRRYRYIRVRVAPRGGGLGSGELRLALRVAPEQLMFIARGEGPFTLAFGRVGPPPPAYSAAELLGLVGRGAAEAPLTSVVPGSLAPLGGEQVLRPVQPTNYRQFALWGILLLSVGVLAALSWRVFRRVEESSHVE